MLAHNSATHTYGEHRVSDSFSAEMAKIPYGSCKCDDDSRFNHTTVRLCTRLVVSRLVRTVRSPHTAYTMSGISFAAENVNQMRSQRGISEWVLSSWVGTPNGVQFLRSIMMQPPRPPWCTLVVMMRTINSPSKRNGKIIFYFHVMHCAVQRCGRSINYYYLQFTHTHTPDCRAANVSTWLI